MANDRYDAIVVGARCAGSPTAMLLARKGYKVLVVDRATFPSDTVSTHLIHPPGVRSLKLWGLLDRLVASGCPAIDTYSFDFGPFALTGSPGPDDSPVSYGPRRTVLDKILVDAAAEAGAEIREGFAIDEIVFDNESVAGIVGHAKSGKRVTERARVVIGADGMNSIIARLVQAEEYHQRPALQAGYYTYWSGLPTNGRLDAYDRSGRGWAAWPTHDNLTLLIVSWPITEFEANKKDIEGSYLSALERAPQFAERVRAAKREERFVGASVRNFFRKPFGPGWALVGDAGYNKDFITAQGISDSFRTAEMCATAIDEAFSGRRTYDDAMRVYQETRDIRALPIYEFTCQFAELAPPPPQMQQLFAAIYGNQTAMDGFAQVFSGVTSPAEFFSEENVGRIFATAKG